jgi:DNA-binding NarL/FixJ family response regulator
VAHDIAWLRQGVRRLLDDEPDITVVAEAEDAVQTLRDVFTHRPDIVVVDHHIFEGTAVQTERLLVRESPSSKVLFLTNHDEESRGEDLADSAYAVRRTSAEELVDMVRKTAAIECTASAQRTGAANILGLSSKTVDAHKFNLMRKLGVHNKAELVMWAIQSKIVKLPASF